jgi:hypothetical protein
MERTMPVNGVQEITANEAVKFLMAEYGKSADEAERLVAGLES